MEESLFIGEGHSCCKSLQLKAWHAQRWGRKETPGYHISLMGPGNQWCGRFTARSPSHSTPWASPSLTERLALCLGNWWEAIEGRGIHGGLGVSQASSSPGCPDLTSPNFQVLINAMNIITKCTQSAWHIVSTQQMVAIVFPCMK